MTPAFGFSVGDFISGINLVRKITQALKETGGASSEYQAAVIELKGLKHALQHLQALEPTEDNLSHVNAIRGMALACQLPLREFLTKLEKYESSLGPWVDRVDESTQLANLPPRRDASECEAAVDRLAKIRKKGKSKEFNYQTLTIMDWNSGTSRLDAWLNQSAVPSTTAAINRHISKTDLLPREIEEIKVFRNVHVTTAPSPEHNNPPLEPVESLDFPARTYYRNIIDNYPAIPVYLARRLAQANSGRAERLRIEKEHHHQREYKDAENHEKLDCQIQIPNNIQYESFLSRLSLAQGDAAPSRRETISPSWPSSTQKGAKDARLYHTLQPVDFWTGGSQTSQPTSARSRSPSMNSTLHDRLGFDPQEQNPTSANEYTARTDCRTPSSPGLPAPPVELGKAMKFNCDICGENVHVNRRLEWQNHVLNDLRPYVCIFRECSHATYASRGALLEHELSVHGEDSESKKSKQFLQTKTCVFCGELLPTAEWEGRSQHVGRHMEEIALTVVTKPYEDWDFYSDVSSVRNQGTDEFCSTSTSHDVGKENGMTHKARLQRLRCSLCAEEETFSRRDDLTRHMREVHPNTYSCLRH